MDLTEEARKALALVMKGIREHGIWHLMFIGLSEDGSLIPILAAEIGEEDRDRVTEVVRNVFDRSGVAIGITTSEGWVSDFDPRTGMALSGRKEVVLAAASDRFGSRVVMMREIVRGDAGEVIDFGDEVVSRDGVGRMFVVSAPENMVMGDSEVVN